VSVVRTLEQFSFQAASQLQLTELLARKKTLHCFTNNFRLAKICSHFVQENELRLTWIITQWRARFTFPAASRLEFGDSPGCSLMRSVSIIELCCGSWRLMPCRISQSINQSVRSFHARQTGRGDQPTDRQTERQTRENYKLHHTGWLKKWDYFLAAHNIKNKNLAIANRSRVSCAHNSSMASPWPWNIR